MSGRSTTELRLSFQCRESCADRSDEQQTKYENRQKDRKKKKKSSPTESGSRRRVFRVLCNMECPVGLSQKRICAHFNEIILRQFGRSAKKYKVQLDSVFELVGRK